MNIVLERSDIVDSFVIPKIIHYCWFGGKEMPAEYRRYIKGWAKMYPDYRIVCWNEKNFPINDFPYAMQAAEQKKWAFVSDVARVYALYRMGGVYLDTDVEAIRPFPSVLNEYSAILGTEHSNETIGTGFMAFVKGHRICESMLDYYRKHSFFEQDKNFSNTQLIALMVNRLYGLVPQNCVQTKRDLVLFSPEYFTAYDTLSNTPVLTENTICVHHFAASWFSSWQKLRRLWWRLRQLIKMK